MLLNLNPKSFRSAGRATAILASFTFHLLKDGTRYIDLGSDFFDRLEPERLSRYYVKRLQKLGHKVVLEPKVIV